MRLLPVVAAIAAVAQLCTAQELVPDHDFHQGQTFWSSYSNFARGEEIRDFSIHFAPGVASIQSRQCEPQSRIGIRSAPLTIPSPPDGQPDIVLGLRWNWSGKNIHRCGIYVRLVNAQGNVLKAGDIWGPGGTFDLSDSTVLALTRNELTSRTRVILYAFQDGGGTLNLRQLSLQPVSLAGDQTPIDGATSLIDSLKLRHNSTSGTPRTLIRRSDHALQSVFPKSPDELLILPGEKRHFLAESCSHPALPRMATHTRDVSLMWELGAGEQKPFWLEAASPSPQGEIVEVSSESTPALTALPPLPPTRHAYMFFWGHYRYSKKPEDLESDRKTLARLRSLGFTGVCLQDDYGLDYGGFVRQATLGSDDYLLRMTSLYDASGMRSPLVYGLYSGLDKGRVSWQPGTQLMTQYLKALTPSLCRSEAMLGKGRLWLWPVDEPNDPARRELALPFLKMWQTQIGLPLMTTLNWQSSGLLTSHNKWVGAGDYPSFAAAKARGVQGFYTGLNACDPALRFRMLAGVHAWASGFASQAYWHFDAVSGSAQNDFDGKQEDFLCIEPGCTPECPTLSFPLVQLAEGLQDLRLLCALEQAAASSPVASQIRSFLADVRSRVLPTDRLGEPWSTPQAFEQMRRRGVELWLLHSSKARQAPHASAAASPQ